MCSINISNRHHLHGKNTKIYHFQKSTFYAEIKIFNSLPPNVTIFTNDKAKFKAAARKCLKTHSYYSVHDFFYV